MLKSKQSIVCQKYIFFNNNNAAIIKITMMQFYGVDVDRESQAAAAATTDYLFTRLFHNTHYAIIIFLKSVFFSLYFYYLTVQPKVKV